MANQQYDQLPALIEGGMDWERVTVYALLYQNAVFDPAHQRASEIGRWDKREKLLGKYVNDDGDLCAQPAVFYMVLPNTEYQLVLGYDDGRNDDLVLGFFDENSDGSPIKAERRGSLFIRPSVQEGEDPPTYSIWLQPGT